MTRIVIIAGETSGDLLAADLIRALANRLPSARFEGITGPGMEAAGCVSWGSYEQLAVMGLVEVLGHLPRILGVKRDIERRLRANPPDLLIGVDAPDFNLRIEKFARTIGIPTVQYVCPSVWAWRTSRVNTIRACCDLVLCLLPFEREFLEANGVAARFIGHPMADQIDGSLDAVAARQVLGLADAPTIALLPGSRIGEVKYLGPAFMETMAWLRERRPELQFAAAVAKPTLRAPLEMQAKAAGVADAIHWVDGDARNVVAAADVVLLASGTATLETMLINRPMVVAYKVSWLTAFLLRRSGLVKIERFALPNLLADQLLVPELLQEDAVPEKLGPAVLEQLDDEPARVRLHERFAELAGVLRCSASDEAAEGVLELLQSRGNTA